MDGGSSVVVGTMRYEDDDLPLAIATGERFPESLNELRHDPKVTITFDKRRAMADELRKIHIAAGVFNGFADVLRAV